MLLYRSPFALGIQTLCLNPFPSVSRAIQTNFSFPFSFVRLALSFFLCISLSLDCLHPIYLCPFSRLFSYMTCISIFLFPFPPLFPLFFWIVMHLHLFPSPNVTQLPSKNPKAHYAPIESIISLRQIIVQLFCNTIIRTTVMHLILPHVNTIIAFYTLPFASPSPHSSTLPAPQRAWLRFVY